jgi:Ca-activated chloride channel family protein
VTFLKIEYALPLMIIFFVFSVLFVKAVKDTDAFITKSFFKSPSPILWIRRAFFILGIGLLFIALLDLRGPEQRIESQVPDQKTIIIIDSSASMLAEDVRPNRFKKAILMARHFVKKAFGHKVAVVLFSDTQKRLVPFTDDLDLLDARVAGLEVLSIYEGGSNISQAIKESLGYFLVEGGKADDVGGNILLFTDSEGHDESFDFSLPENVTLAAVGVGTLKGARIPNRDRYGVFRGYKKFKGTEVVSRLNEDWLKALSERVKTYKYWVANSYTIPTEEILSFFNRSYDKKIKKGMATMRPVKTAIVLVPAVICLIISFISYPATSYAMLIAFCFLFPIRGEDLPENLKNEQINDLMGKMKNGELTPEGKLKFAEVLLRNKEAEASRILYEENLKFATPEHLNNYAVSLIQAKRPQEALKVLSRLQQRARVGDIKLEDTQRNEIRQNVLLALRAQEQQQKQKQEQKKKEENKDQKKKQNSGEGSEGDSSDKKKKESDGEEGKEKQKKKGKSEKKNQDQEKGDKKKDESPKNFKEHQEDVKKKRKMVKIPGLIKQIMSDDRSLQKKYLDTSTNKPKQNQKKDW